MIRDQQLLEEGKEINPIEIKIEDKKIQNIFEMYKNNKIRFKLNDILFVSSVLNKTENIFLQTTGLKSRKYILLNGDYK